MDLYMIILRLVHIFAGVIWVGFAVFMLFFLGPTLGRVQPEGSRFMHGLFQHTPFGIIMPVVTLLTTLAGVLLYLRVSDNLSSLGDFLGTTGGLVLTIGAVAGIVAFVFGLVTLGPIAGRQKAALEKIYSQSGPPSEELRAELQALGQKMSLYSRIDMVLLVITLIGMAAARYFG